MEKNSSSFEYANRLPNSLFQGNREKFFKAFKQQVPDHGKALLLFKGKEEIPIDSTDIEYTVKQESFFYYLFGVHETGCSAAIDISEEKVYLFFPNFSEIYKIWFKVLSTEEIRSLYPDFEIFYMNDLEQWVKDFAPSQIFINKGVNSDSGLDTLVLSFKWMDDYTIEQTKMHNILSDCRSIKTPDEIKIMEIAVAISSEAHVHTMKHCKPGVRESYLESKFRAYCHERYNCKFSHYQSICAWGPNSSTLHYNTNCDILPETSMCLMDMGQAFLGYGADITCCYPTNGVFTEKQKLIYNLVLKANRTVMAQLKPGVKWPDMHILAEKVLLEGLIELGIVKGDIDDMLDNRVCFVFFPHGLGHLLGLDAHEVGSYLPHHPPRSDKWGLKNLRFARELEEGLVLTVEPGCYFIKSLLVTRDVDIGIDVDKYVNVDKAMEYAQEVAGVRIEDNVVITSDGWKNLTVVPRTVEQIEACMRGEDWTLLPDFQVE